MWIISCKVRKNTLNFKLNFKYSLNFKYNLFKIKTIVPFGRQMDSVLRNESCNFVEYRPITLQWQ
jgi:hypothetical protein